MNFISFYLTSHFTHSNTILCSAAHFSIIFLSVLYCTVHTNSPVEGALKDGQFRVWMDLKTKKDREKKTGTDEQAFISIIHYCWSWDFQDFMLYCYCRGSSFFLNFSCSTLTLWLRLYQTATSSHILQHSCACWQITCIWVSQQNPAPEKHFC